MSGRADVTPLNRVEVFTLAQAAMYLGHGFRLSYKPRGGRLFMVRKTVLEAVANNNELPISLRNQAE